ncbi:hypothetical protein BELL_0057g00040 [Botrytis elliptica]|uniref:Uncharacterized protein n=1 Tax=Botrytis elliptica TaxID=278938 RepID=A0A4Z1K3W0_9HELO|nr:hypothetical protein BELL_0057g00040 [Botrytis elliptica]
MVRLNGMIVFIPVEAAVWSIEAYEALKHALKWEGGRRWVEKIGNDTNIFQYLAVSEPASPSISYISLHFFAFFASPIKCIDKNKEEDIVPTYSRSDCTKQ